MSEYLLLCAYIVSGRIWKKIISGEKKTNEKRETMNLRDRAVGGRFLSQFPMKLFNFNCDYVTMLLIIKLC